MRKHLLALSLALALITASTQADLWGDHDKEEIQRLHHQVEQEQAKAGGAIIIAAGLGVLAAGTFIVGIVLGTRAIRHARAKRTTTDDSPVE